MKTYFSKKHKAIMSFTILLNTVLFVTFQKIHSELALEIIELLFCAFILLSISVSLYLTNNKHKRKISTHHSLIALNTGIVLYLLYLKILIKNDTDLSSQNTFTLVIGFVCNVILGKIHLTILRHKKRW